MCRNSRGFGFPLCSHQAFPGRQGQGSPFRRLLLPTQIGEAQLPLLGFLRRSVRRLIACVGVQACLPEHYAWKTGRGLVKIAQMAGIEDAEDCLLSTTSFLLGFADRQRVILIVHLRLDTITLLEFSRHLSGWVGMQMHFPSDRRT
jgi:hypothetical protein